MKKILFSVCIFMLAGCSTMAPLGLNVVRQTPENISHNSKQIAVSKVLDTIEQGKVIGKAYGGTLCLSKGDLFWKGNEKVMRNVEDMLRTKLEKYGYSLVGKANSPFNEEFSKQAELLLGGRLDDVKSNACFSVRGVKGDSYVKVEWQVYNAKTNDVVFTVNTEGYASDAEFNELGDTDRYKRAFDMSIDNLLADKTFRAFITK